MLCILTSIQVAFSPGSKLDPALFSIGAGVILFLFGIFTFRRKVLTEEDIKERTKNILNEKDDKPVWIVFFGKGFALNILNPFVWIFWFSSVAVVAGSMGGNKVRTIVFFAIILATTLALELLKAWGAAKLKVFFNAERTTMLNKVAGILLMLCSAYFIIFRGIVHLV